MDNHRLIDANAFALELDEIKSCLMNETKNGKIRAEMVDFVEKHLSAMPTIDPESLRPVSEWELNPYRFSCEHFRCKECHHIDCISDNYCGKCGARMKNAGVKPEDLPIPEEENSRAKKSDDGNGEWEECGGME